MRDYEDPVHVPPLALKIIAAALVVCFVIAPLVVAIKNGISINALVTVGLGLALVAFVLGAMFIYRLVLWFVYTFYWYLAACGGIVLFFFALAVVGGIATMPEPIKIDQIPPIFNVLIAGGAILGLVALILVFRPSDRHPEPETKPAQPPAPQPPNPQKRILDTAQQIASRKKDLGLDDN